jgi:hypothetical protein
VTQERVISRSALEIREDEAVAPPLTVLVSANRELEGYRFRVTGLVRNDAAEAYAGLGLVATFFKEDGSRFGPIRAEISCPILGPGGACPFTVEAIDKSLAEVMLHPEGYPSTRRQPIPAEARGVGLYTDALGHLHIAGSLYNPNSVAIQDASISGVLRDAQGEIVSVGTAVVIGPLAPNASDRFDILLQYAPYATYQLYIQAVPPQ